MKTAEVEVMKMEMGAAGGDKDTQAGLGTLEGGRGDDVPELADGFTPNCEFLKLK